MATTPSAYTNECLTDRCDSCPRKATCRHDCHGDDAARRGSAPTGVWLIGGSRRRRDRSTGQWT